LDLGIYSLRLVVALFIGGLMGLERQFHRRMAGTRTHALVAAGAAAFVMTAPFMHGDPSAQGRIVSYVVSGVGFLGAGVIFKEGGQIQGLNTAASIWCAAAVGTLAGLGLPIHSAITAAGVLIVNAALRPLAYKFRHPVEDNHEAAYSLEVICRRPDEFNMRRLLLQLVERAPIAMRELQSEDVEQIGHRKLTAALQTATRDDKSIEEVAARFSLEECVTSVRWNSLPAAQVAQAKAAAQ
jgi:putative Mg2+ transporter-C (MgtC) family protein